MRPAAPLVSLILLTALAAPADARPFSAKRVPFSAEGIIHVDLDGLRGSRLWKAVTAKHDPADIEAMARAEMAEDLAEVGGKELIDLGVDVATRARGVTFWVDADEKGALLVDMPDARRVAARLAKVTSSTKKTERGVTMYRLPGDDPGYLTQHGDTLLFSDDPDAIVKGVGVLRGKARSLPPAKLGVPAGRGILFAAGFGGKVMDAVRKGATAKSFGADIRTLTVHAGEDGAKLYLAARAETDAPATAAKLAAVMQGLLALVSLADDEPELQALVRGLTVTTQGKAVSARIEMPIATFAKLVEGE